MKRWLTTLVVFAACSAAVHADVTIVQTTTIEGGMAAMAGQTVQPKITSRIKGMKSRSDVDASIIQVSTIADLDTKQVVVLRPDQKTAQIIKLDAAAAKPRTDVTPPSVDTSISPTGKLQVIDGVKCDEYTFSVALNMSDVNRPGMPAEAADMMKGIKMIMKGSMWLTKDVPGAAEYIAYQKAIAGSSDIASIVSSAAGMQMPGMEKMMSAMHGMNGLAYLTEMTINIEGTGQMAEMMQQAGAMKITTKVTSITTDPIPDDMFKVPDGYTVIKQ